MSREMIEKFVEVTGESEATASQYLTLTDGNLESAISLMFEGGGEASSVAPTNVAEPPVRPPILPTREVLVPTDPLCAFPRASNSVFDRFRDFAVETQRQEEEMTRQVAGVRKMSARKTKRLEDLFRPPSDVLFLGSFVEAREHAKHVNRWLLVNVQDPQEFACQTLNRDVWSNKQIRDIVQDHFVLWQVLSNTADGRRFIDFYNVNQYPYLAILDPRTGECMRTYNHITVDSLAAGLQDMLSTHASPESAPQDPSSTGEWASGSGSKKFGNSEERAADSASSKASSSCSSSSSSSSSCNNSLPSSSFSVLSKRSRIDEFEAKKEAPDDAAKEEKPDRSPITSSEPESSDEPLLRLCLRLPSGGKQAISMTANDTVENFLRRMDRLGYPPSEHTYLVPFPKTNVGALSPETRLSETILFPSNTVFITKI